MGRCSLPGMAGIELKWEAEGEKRSRWARITNDAPAIRQGLEGLVEGLDEERSPLTKAGVARHV